MTRKQEKDLISQLKTLRGTPEGGWPCLEMMEKSRSRLISYMAMAENRVDSAQTVNVNHVSRWGLVIGFVRYMVPARLVYVTAGFIFVLTGAAVVAVSRQALPGDTLYGAKIAVEAAQVRFTSNPASRAKVQMGMAGNRLKEAIAISQTGNEQNGRVGQALDRFTNDVKEAKNALKQAHDPEQVQNATSELARKATEYRQGLQQAKASLEQSSPTSVPDGAEPASKGVKKTGREVGLASIAEAEKALTEMEAIAQDAENAGGVSQPKAGTDNDNEADSQDDKKADDVKKDDVLKSGEVGI